MFSLNIEMNLTKNRLILLFLFHENGIFCVQGGRQERWPPKFVRHGQFI